MSAPVSLCMEFVSVAYWMVPEGLDDEVMKRVRRATAHSLATALALGYERNYSVWCAQVPEAQWELIREHLRPG